MLLKLKEFFHTFMVFFMSTTLWALPCFAQISDADTEASTASNIEFREQQAAQNTAYQSEVDTSNPFTQSTQCSESSLDSDVQLNSVKAASINRKGKLLDRFRECLFNNMTEADDLRTANSNLNATLGAIGSFTGFDGMQPISGASTSSANLSSLQSESTEIDRQLMALRASTTSDCFPTEDTNPSFCRGIDRQAPGSCDVVKYEEITRLQRRKVMLAQDIQVLQQRAGAESQIAAGGGISATNSGHRSTGTATLNSLEQWEESKTLYSAAITEERAARAHLQSVRTRCIPSTGVTTLECRRELNIATTRYNTAIANSNAKYAYMNAKYNEVIGGGGGARQGQADNSNSAAQQGSTYTQNTLDNIENSASKYSKYLEKINAVNKETQSLHNEAQAYLQQAQRLAEDKKVGFDTDYEMFDLVQKDISDGTLTQRDKELLVSDLSLLGTTSAANFNLMCLEVGYNKITQRVEHRKKSGQLLYRSRCPTGSAAQIPEDLAGRMANPNATFEQCYVRSYTLFKAASAMYLAAEINGNANFNAMAQNCLMKCVSIDNPSVLSAMGIDVSTREPNCVVNSNDTYDGSPGIYINDGSAGDDKNEQMASLERAANLYGNMVTQAQLKQSTKEQALDMFQVAYQAALEEMTAKTERVATSKANLDAARAAGRNADNTIMLILAAIAGYTAAKIGYQNSCGPHSPFPCSMIPVMGAAIAAALAYLLFLRGQKQTSEEEIAYWSEELKDAQLHGHMACNYPGLAKDYRYLSHESINNPSPERMARYAVIGVDRDTRGVHPSGITLGTGESLGSMLNTHTDSATPGTEDLYDAYDGYEPRTPAGDRVDYHNPSGSDAPTFDEDTGRCVGSGCHALPEEFRNPPDRIPGLRDSTRTGRGAFILNGTLPESKKEKNISSREAFTNFVNVLDKIGVVKFFDVFISTSRASTTDSAFNTADDETIGNLLGMDGLNNMSDFSYYLAIKMEALKMQTLDNTTTVNLQENPVDVSHLKGFDGCDMATTNCRIEEHLEDFVHRPVSSFTTLPPGGYMQKLPESAGFPLPETRHVYLMSVINMLQNNLLLHANRFGDCITRDSNGNLADSNSTQTGTDSAPTTICGMANRYAQLVRYARRQMELGTEGLDTDTPDIRSQAFGTCLMTGPGGNPIIDRKCECRLNGTCIKYTAPTFGNFTKGLTSSGTFSTDAANKALSGDLKGANVSAGKLADQSNAIQGSIRRQQATISNSFNSQENLGTSKTKKANSPLLENPFDRSKEVALFHNRGIDSARAFGAFDPNDTVNNAANTKNSNNAIANKNNKEISGITKNSSTNSKNNSTNGQSATGKIGFYAGKDAFNLDEDSGALNDGVNFNNVIDMSALHKMQAQEASNNKNIKRSFASLQKTNKNNKKDWDGINQNQNISLFRIISRRYRKTAYPLFMKK